MPRIGEPLRRAARAALLCCSIAPVVLFGQSPCVDGMAGEYPCQGIDLMSVRSFEEMGGNGPGNGNDCWGWTSEGREFVLFGRSDGTSIVEITDPVNPVLVANVPTASVPSLWRDIKVIDDVAYIVSEAGEHGIQVVDLSPLTGEEPMVATLAHYTGFGGAHNIAANPETHFVYGLGTGTFSGGLHIVDVSSPSNPVLAGSWDEHYIHDAQVVVYNGPDPDHVGKEIAFVFSGFSGCHIVDVDDKTDCSTIASITGPEFIYPHQGWLTEDQRFLLMNDEMDESAGIAPNTRTWVFNVQDLDDPQVLGFHEGTLSVTDHNLYTHQGFVFEANYYAGLQVLQIINPETLAFLQVAHFDTNPFSNQTGTSGGAWSVYPYFESGNIAISTQSHLFIVHPSAPFASVVERTGSTSLEVMYGEGVVTVEAGPGLTGELKVFDSSGRLQAEWKALEGRSHWFVQDWPTGVYVLRHASGLQQRFLVE